MSNLFKASLLLTLLFGLDKVVGLIRQIIIGRQFGLSGDIDAFNIANNLPDLIVALISGGALAIALIPVLSEYKENLGHSSLWKLFSQILNLTFLTTAFISLVIAVFAEPIVKSQFGIAPGFNQNQQTIVINLMRMNLIAAVIFSLSGLAMASLNVHKHFLLPALAPILYNFGQIFGALILAPHKEINLGMLTLPAFGMGVYGLGVGVLIGATFHFLIQVPGLLHYRFRWYPNINLKDPGVQKVLNLFGPRILTVLFIQIIFLVRDNLGSRLHEGAVSILTYGYFIMQVPETLIGSTVATALLPTISDYFTQKKQREFQETISKTIQILFVISIAATVLLSITLPPLISSIFKVNVENINLLVWTTRAFLAGLAAQTILEVVVRAFYARQDAKTPLVATFIRLITFIVISIISLSSLGVVGLALADSFAILVELTILIIILHKQIFTKINYLEILLRLFLSSGLAIAVTFAIFSTSSFHPVIQSLSSLVFGSLIYLIFINKEI